LQQDIFAAVVRCGGVPCLALLQVQGLEVLKQSGTGFVRFSGFDQQQLLQQENRITGLLLGCAITAATPGIRAAAPAGAAVGDATAADAGTPDSRSSSSSGTNGHQQHA
jgi:predicted DNA-binding transcriptional regulator YafY